jgi:hypothetical protein
MTDVSQMKKVVPEGTTHKGFPAAGLAEQVPAPVGGQASAAEGVLPAVALFMTL